MAAIERRLYRETESNDNFKGGVVIDNYQGKISLVAANVGTDENIYTKWCFSQKREDGENVPGKVLPVKVLLGGSKIEALETLQFFMDIINGKTNNSAQQEQQNQERKHDDGYQGQGPPPEDDGIPF